MLNKMVCEREIERKCGNVNTYEMLMNDIKVFFILFFDLLYVKIKSLKKPNPKTTCQALFKAYMKSFHSLNTL